MPKVAVKNRSHGNAFVRLHQFTGISQESGLVNDKLDACHVETGKGHNYSKMVNSSQNFFSPVVTLIWQWRIAAANAVAGF